jgi:3-oxoacyl-[acyl-carrier-protein] synthase-3
LALIEGRPVGILGTGMKLPERIVKNSCFEGIVDTSDEWIKERTGIHARHIASEGESNAFMASCAALEAMKDADVSPKDIDMIIVGTNSPDTLFPGVGPVVQGMIGAVKSGGMDLQAGCPGSLYAIVAGAGGIASGIWDKVVVIGSERITPLVDQSDRNTCVLFGDGAGACVMGPWIPGGLRVTHADLKADGEKSWMITLPAGCAEEPASEKTVREGRHFLKMHGKDVFKFISRELPVYLENFCKNCGITLKEVDCWIFHQANIRIIENVLHKMDIPAERAVVNLDRYGNTSAASIILALHEARTNGRIYDGQKIIVTSFGAGMTHGAVLIES